MNITADKIVSEARARIFWGESFSSVRAFLVSNGVSDADADALIQKFVFERNREIRSIGVRSILLGGLLAGSAGGVLYWMATWILPPGAARVYGFGGRGIIAGVIVLGAIALYGAWRLVRGVVYLVRPQSEHKSVPDISE
jgi:hypothetical protein